MLLAVRQKVYPFALGLLLSFLPLLNTIIVSPLFAAECGGATSCG